jgi:hypothetical protein
MLKPEYRGAAKTFGDDVKAEDTARAVDRLVAFMGAHPAWQASA